MAHPNHEVWSFFGRLRSWVAAPALAADRAGGMASVVVRKWATYVVSPHGTFSSSEDLLNEDENAEFSLMPKSLSGRFSDERKRPLRRRRGLPFRMGGGGGRGWGRDGTGGFIGVVLVTKQEQRGG